MDEKPNEIVSDAPVAATETKTNISYFRPALHLRVFANLIDILILVFVFLSSFLGVRELIKINPTYKAKSEELIQIKIDSGVYEYDDDNILRDIVSVVKNDKGQSAKSRAVRSRKAIERFVTYASEVCSDETYKIIVDDYRSFRLDPSMTKGDIPLFVIDEETNDVIENPVLLDGVESISSQIYVDIPRNKEL